MGKTVECMEHLKSKDNWIQGRREESSYTQNPIPSPGLSAGISGEWGVLIQPAAVTHEAFVLCQGLSPMRLLSSASWQGGGQAERWGEAGLTASEPGYVPGVWTWFRLILITTRRRRFFRCPSSSFSSRFKTRLPIIPFLKMGKWNPEG